MSRILVIRGGAIGDFILTLPTLKALRGAYSRAHIEILGYKHIAVLAENRFYAQAVRSIEYGPLSSFFAKNSELPAELANYFASFDLIISYLYDPDGVFEMNLRRCGVDDLIHGPGKIDHRAHAARQLSRPLQNLGLCIEDFSAKLYPSAKDRDAANDLARRLRATNRRVSSRQRRQEEKLAAGKLDRPRKSSDRVGRFSRIDRRHFRRSGHRSSCAAPINLERRDCSLCKKFAIAAPRCGS